MTGPEHYKAAQEILLNRDVAEGLERRAQQIARAQVHATLALAAATAELDAYNVDGQAATGRREPAARAWHEVTQAPGRAS